ncbi:VOC family protein [Rhodococcus wratislaviensis]|uniref:VOC family protein n=1 Tax=Rhodococcus wratislaviensis TaxID=44752 RepID=UPI00351498FB
MNNPLPKFDHTAVAVSDARACLRQLRTRLGATVLAGETMDHFRYAVTHLGDQHSGMKLEVVEPHGLQDGFLHRFIRDHGEGAHHITFVVPDLELAINAFHSGGMRVVKQDLQYPPWREAFVAPADAFNIVIQLADTTLDPCLIDSAITGELPDATMIPHAANGRDRRWWKDIRELPGSSPTTMVRTVLGVRNRSRAEYVFGELLGGRKGSGDECWQDFHWGQSTLRIETHPTDRGVLRIELVGRQRTAMSIGSLDLRCVEEPRA